MARSRNIKPGLFKNEVLGMADPLYTLAFQGLWLLADRAGRLEDRPLRIRAETFPYREGIDIDAILAWLHDEGFIQRYQAGEKRYIQVLNFGKHQNPHKNEKTSEIPAFDDLGSDTEIIGTHSEKIGSTPADSLLLIPDSLNPTSDADASVVASELSDSCSAQHAADPLPTCPHQDVIRLFAKHLPELPQPRVWEGQRASNLKMRWRWILTAKKPNGALYAISATEALAYLDRFFAHVATSDFLTGRNGKWDGCSLAWLVKAENFAKVIEGQYDNREVV